MSSRSQDEEATALLQIPEPVIGPQVIVGGNILQRPMLELTQSAAADDLGCQAMQGWWRSTHSCTEIGSAVKPSAQQKST
jgi:hypothetical protein